MKRLITIPILVSMLLLMAACTTGPDRGERVGNSCRDDVDCARGSTCLRGRDFPDGMCSYRCDRSSDCPDYAECVDDEGGVCLLSCFDDFDCPDDYECKSRSARGTRGDYRICIGD